MTLTDCISLLLRTKALPEMVEAGRQVGPTTGTDDEVKAAWESLRRHLAANNHRQAVATALALLWLDPDDTLRRIRKDGVLRASRYRYTAACIRKVADVTLSLADELELSPERRAYLSSILALTQLAGGAKQLYKSILDRLSARHHVCMKTLMAIVNAAFSVDYPGDRMASSRSLDYWSATEQASAFSRLYTIVRDELGIKAWTYVDDAATDRHQSLYAGLLVDAAKLNELIDAEVMIDGLPYGAEATSDGVTISAIDPAFEQSVRLGYIQTSMQMSARVALQAEWLQQIGVKVASFKDILAKSLEALGQFVVLKTVPQSRLVIELPSIPPLIEILSSESPYLDEYGLLYGAHVDHFQTPEMGMLQVSEKLTAIDLFKVQRLFILVDTMFRSKLQSFTDEIEQRKLLIRSTVMVIKRHDLVRWLNLVISEDKIEELISLLLLPAEDQVKGSSAFIDIQYRPLLSSSDDYIAAAPALLGRSNLVRSVIHTSKIKAATKAKDDPMQAAVVSALREAGFLVDSSVDFNINGRRETDIFCYRDGVLFVFECKNGYHPCSPHELRNTYDLIVTSERQLDIRAAWLAECANQAKLFVKLGWTVPPTSRVYTCCITANRLLSGYRMGSHPVRQAHEFINVVRNGFIQLVGHNNPQRRFWKGDEFHADDLIDYLEGKSVVQVQIEALVPDYRRFEIRGRTLTFKEFAMNLESAVRVVDEQFRIVSVNGKRPANPPLSQAS